MTHESPGRRTASKKNALPIGVLSPGSRLPGGRLATASLLFLGIASGVRADSGPEPEVGRLRSHVEILASPEYGGRRGELAEKSRVYLIDAFKRLGLEPLFGESFYQDIPDRQPGPPMGRNVGARLVGSDPALRDQWVIVAAHFDHLGVRDGVLYPGADDNASAVAMMLEVARCLVESPKRPRRSVMFIGFDLEERGLFGSRYFAEHPPIPLDKVALFVTADMIGRSLGGVCPEHVFVMGTERFPAGRAWVRESSGGMKLRVGLLGADLLLLDRSDYGPFRTRSVPFLFFSTGENPCYHRPSDTADTLDYPKFAAISRLIHRVVRHAVDDDARPTWLGTPDHGMDEARALREVFQLLRDNRERLAIGRTPAFLLDTCQEMLDGIVSRNAITPGERARLIRMAQVIMAAVF